MTRRDVHPSGGQQGVDPADRMAYRGSFRPRSFSRFGSRGRSGALLVLGDLAALVALPVLVNSPMPWPLMSTLFAVLLFINIGLYRPRLQWSVLDDLPALAGSLLAGVAVTSVLLASVLPSRLTDLIVPALLSAPLLLLSRGLTYWFIRSARKSGAVGHRTLVVGNGSVAAEVVGLIRAHPELGLLPVGYVDEAESEEMAQQLIPRLGEISSMDDVIDRFGITVLVVAFAATSDRDISVTLHSRSAARCTLFVVPRLYEVMSLKGVWDHIGAIPVVRVRRVVADRVSPMTKRLFDVVASLLALVVLSPVLFACAIAVRITGPGVLFRQQRVGKDGVLFELLKFRSMTPMTGKDGEGAWSAVGDPRVTRVGTFLRRTSLDELPQLWNILRGEMTVVGPRPERPVYAERFSREHPTYAHRHRVPVGLTGMAQVSGQRGGETSIGLRARYDNYYIENWSLWGDIKVILRTVGEVVRGGWGG